MKVTGVFKMESTIVVFLLAVFCAQDGSALQRFEKQPVYTEVNPGQDALLTCKVLNKRGSCSWQKDNKPVGIYPKKYEWAAVDGSARSPSGGMGGDCSLWVRAATLEFDDGHWECQVTASDFTTQDALTSLPVRLVVRVAPQRPRIEHNASHILPGHNISARSGESATVKCVSHYGNPPAVLKWFLGQQELTPSRPQMNATELDNARTWSATSILEVPAHRPSHGLILRCVALHESYPTRSADVEVRLDVRYAPTIRLLGTPLGDLEEGRDTLVMRCIADANPPASVVWRRAGRADIASLEESLQLRPVGRRDAGLYTCQAQNSVGQSEALSVQLDVKYPPRILSVGPDRLTTAPLFSPAAFECVAEGNPTPTYQWLQRVPTAMDTVLERGRESRLVINNVTYDFQGEYVCKVSNHIGGSERIVQSEPIAVQVVGAPQVLRHASAPQHEVWVKRGESVSLSLVVCADPRPRHVAWEWGSLRLEAGAGIGRYRVDEVSQDSREDCYLATLHISDTDPADSRPYYLVVENDRGADRHAVRLVVDEPLPLPVLLGVAGGCLAGLLLLVCLCVWAVRTEKCCFRRRGDFKPTDLDNEKPELNDKARLEGPGGLPITADAIYTTPARYGGGGHLSGPHVGRQGSSPEAMKRISTLNTFRDSQNKHQSVDHFYAALMSSRPTIPRLTSAPSVTSDDTIQGFERNTNNDIRASNTSMKHNLIYNPSPRLYERDTKPIKKYHTMKDQQPNMDEFDCLGIPDATRPKSNVENVINAFECMSRQDGGASMTSRPTSAMSGSHIATRAEKSRNSGYKPRPRPLNAYDSDKYFEHVFPVDKMARNTHPFQPNSIDRAEL